MGKKRWHRDGQENREAPWPLFAEERYISVDVDMDGPVHGRHSMLSLGASTCNAAVAALVGVGVSTVHRTKCRSVEGGLEVALSEGPRAGARRKLTGPEEGTEPQRSSQHIAPRRVRLTRHREPSTCRTQFRAGREQSPRKGAPPPRPIGSLAQRSAESRTSRSKLPRSLARRGPTGVQQVLFPTRTKDWSTTPTELRS